jgi:hypothetical protein
VTAPKRLIAKRERRELGETVSVRGRTMTNTWHYESVLTLECGHVLTYPGHDGGPRKWTRCKECAALQAKVERLAIVECRVLEGHFEDVPEYDELMAALKGTGLIVDPNNLEQTCMALEIMQQVTK